MVDRGDLFQGCTTIAVDNPYFVTMTTDRTIFLDTGVGGWVHCDEIISHNSETWYEDMEHAWLLQKSICL